MVSPRQKTRGRRLGFWLLLALILHTEALVVVGVALYLYAPRNAEIATLRGAGATADGESIDIATIDDETARKLLAELDRQEEQAKEEEVKKEREAKEAPGQVVDLPKPVTEERPDNAKFAAEYDSSVEKETRKHGRFDQKSRQGDAVGEADATKPAAEAASPSRAAPPGALAMRTPGQPRTPSARNQPARPAVAPIAGEDGPPAAQDPDGALMPGGRVSAQPPIAAQAPGGSSGGPVMPPGAPPTLTPSRQQLARAIGGGTQDHLKDIDDGNETALNAKKWKFASFFNRMKSQVREHWHPADAYRRRDPTGSIYGSKDRYTLLRVQLKPDGSLANVALETPSGVEFLDDEAIEAFKQAQPFPNPPPQLVDAGSGMIDFRFGFYFEITGAPRFKVFRYNNTGSM